MQLYYSIVLSFAFIAITFAKPASEVEVVKEVNRHDATDGNYHFNYKLNDGTHFKETRKLEDAGGEAPSITVKGLFSFVENGVEYTVRYTADATGFHPEGDHLPRAPDAEDEEIAPRILGAISKAI
ncbi:larval cuticle protein 65Ag1-like isoform X3 [Chrysoperla carnea]|uniref:larval cuticle protein 65Ag1-like isoform X3 n=1 Tax=Chrysoperla carnea TaxID=189513 RepID=UPI001D08361B|nr:larval cuticle protein 65Ag1-like isoform X3 [Chrysoperla carnea]